MTDHVVVVEDEAALADALRKNLEEAGFDVTVYDRGDEAWGGLQGASVDLVVLALLLPGMDGLEVTRRMRGHDRLSEIPILMLTAEAEEKGRAVGSGVGADEYITKPFSPRELVLRVEAVLRRASDPEAGATGAGKEDRWLAAGELRLDPDGRRTLVCGEEVSLTPTEFNLLRVLMERSGKAQTRSNLLAEVWGYADDVNSRTVDTHIRRLRKKLGDHASQIETVIGVGYKLKA